jgi:hypothetical protein
MTVRHQQQTFTAHLFSHPATLPPSILMQKCSIILQAAGLESNGQHSQQQLPDIQRQRRRASALSHSSFIICSLVTRPSLAALLQPSRWRPSAREPQFIPTMTLAKRHRSTNMWFLQCVFVTFCAALAKRHRSTNMWFLQCVFVTFCADTRGRGSRSPV